MEFVSEPVETFARTLRRAPGKHIWMMGGGELIASFLDAGEIDEFIIKVVPVLIGEGIPLITPKHRRVPLRLRSAHKFPDGVVSLNYAVKNEALRRSPDRRRADTMALAAFAPERPFNPVPGCVPDPHRYRLRIGVA